MTTEMVPLGIAPRRRQGRHVGEWRWCVDSCIAVLPQCAAKIEWVQYSSSMRAFTQRQYTTTHAEQLTFQEPQEHESTGTMCLSREYASGASGAIHLRCSRAPKEKGVSTFSGGKGAGTFSRASTIPRRVFQCECRNSFRHPFLRTIGPAFLFSMGTRADGMFSGNRG